MTKGSSKAKRAAFMISAVAEQYQIHPQTLRLYEREGLLKPSRSEGNTRLYTDTDLERLEKRCLTTKTFSNLKARRAAEIVLYRFKKPNWWDKNRDGLPAMTTLIALMLLGAYY